jgi:hypothetical protein
MVNVCVDCIVISSIQINHCHCPAELVNRKILDENIATGFRKPGRGSLHLAQSIAKTMIHKLQ